MVNNAIQVQKLTKRFGSKLALNGVSFTVPKGQIVGFLGPNGAGKTTTIRCMMDFIRPSSGIIKIDGKNAQEKSTELKQIIGFLSSDSQINGSWTVADHLEIVKKMRGQYAKTNELVQLLDLDTKAKVKNLSSGNKQKLSIVLAFAGQPKILIMDEPTRGLDPVLQNNIYEMLEDYAKQGNTVFFSSHNLAEVQRVCDTVIIIKDGKIITEQGMKEIRGINTHIVHVNTSNKLDRQQLDKLDVELISITDYSAQIKLKGKLNPLLEYLTKQAILDLSIGHASLEDLFLEMYKD